jgi:beta-lactamase class A
MNTWERLQEAEGSVGLYYRAQGEPARSFQGDVPLVAASVIKIPIMVEAFRRIHAGALDPTAEVEIRPEHKMPSCGALTYMHDGLKPTLSDLITLMIILSDNTATNILIDKLGMANINRTIQALGCKDTVLGRKMLDSAAKKAGHDNWTTAADVAKVWKAIRDSKFGPRMMAMLSVQKNIFKLPAKLPIEDPDDFEPILAHKTGELPGVEHDTGIFFWQTKTPVLTIVLTKGLPSRQAGWEFASTIGLDVYAHFLPKEPAK